MPPSLSRFSARGRVLKQIQSLFQEKDYSFVKRAPVNWASVDWAKYKRGVAILCDDSTLFPNEKGIHSMTVSIEAFTKLPSSVEEIDESVMDQFYEDAHSVLVQLTQQKIDGQPVIFRRFGDNVVEAHDASLGVQGVVITISLDF